jgi:hypothetical protein
MCLHVLDMCATACQMIAVYRMGGVDATRCCTFVVSHCMLRAFRVDLIFICFATMRCPLGTDCVSNGREEQYQRIAHCCHDMSIHKIISGFAIDARDY